MVGDRVREVRSRRWAHLCWSDVYEGFDEGARSAIGVAQDCSRRKGAVAAGADHLLVGVASGNCQVAGLLRVAGVTPEAVMAALPEGPPIVGERSDRWTARAKLALEMSLRERLAAGDAAIGVGHLALAVLNDACSEAAEVLRLLGVAGSGLRERLRSQGHVPSGCVPPSWPEPRGR